jgi:hypothetical protein
MRVTRERKLHTNTEKLQPHGSDTASPNPKIINNKLPKKWSRLLTAVGIAQILALAFVILPAAGFLMIAPLFFHSGSPGSIPPEQAQSIAWVFTVIWSTVPFAPILALASGLLLLMKKKIGIYVTFGAYAFETYLAVIAGSFIMGSTSSNGLGYLLPVAAIAGLATMTAKGWHDIR